MNKVLETINSRVSCREYSEKKVPLSKLKLIAEAGKMAPSAINRQIANILILNSKRYVEKLRSIALETQGKDNYYGAKQMILVYGPKEDKFTCQDCTCILENMFIAATALKVNSCWINRTNEFLDTPKGLKLRKALGIPEDAWVVGTVIVGYAKEGAKLDPKPRKEDFIKII